VVVELQTVRPEFEVKVKTTKRNPITKVKRRFSYFRLNVMLYSQVLYDDDYDYNTRI